MTRHSKKAYKFLKAQFAASLIERGELRVGTATEFRAPDGIDGGRSDADELSAEWNPGATTIPLTPDHPLAEWFGLKVPKVNGAINLRTSAGTVLRRQAEAYLFCASWEITASMTKQMAEKFGYDACIRIDDFPEFAALLSEHPSLKGRLHGLDRVTYKSTISVRDLSEKGVFVKHPRFGWQKEVRIVWGGEGIAGGIIIEVPDVIPLLKRVF